MKSFLALIGLTVILVVASVGINYAMSLNPYVKVTCHVEGEHSLPDCDNVEHHKKALPGLLSSFKYLLGIVENQKKVIEELKRGTEL